MAFFDFLTVFLLCIGIAYVSFFSLLMYVFLSSIESNKAFAEAFCLDNNFSRVDGSFCVADEPFRRKQFLCKPKQDLFSNKLVFCFFVENSVYNLPVEW